MIYAITPTPEGRQLADTLDDAMQLATTAAAEGYAAGAYAIPAIDAGFALDLILDAQDAETRRRVTELTLAACAPAIADPNLVANVAAACAPVDDGGVPDRMCRRIAGHAVTTGGPHGPLVDLRLTDVGGGGRLAILAMPYAKIDDVDAPLDRPTPIDQMVASKVITPTQITRAIKSMIPAIAEAAWWTGDESQRPRFMPEERQDILLEGRRYVESGGIVKHTSAPWPEKIWDDHIPAGHNDPEACCRDRATGLACYCCADHDAA